MSSISILIKPASSSCNLRCKYCFYSDVADNRDVVSHGIMSEDTMTSLIKKGFEEDTKAISFAFQGGEPTVAGLDFFKNFVQAVNKYNVKNISVNYSIQTNGCLLNEEWAEFFKANNFLVGISLDGPKDINDQLRITPEHKGSYNQVMKAIKLLKQYDVPFNILCVLTSFNSKHIRKVYKFFKKEGFNYLQFIPCLEPLDKNEPSNKYSLKNSDYKYALNNLFTLYKEDFFKGDYTSIRLFDNYIQMYLGYPAENCGISGICSCYYVIESNGDVYPCDFFALDKYKLGNINEMSFNEMRQTPLSASFIKESTFIEEKCLHCKYIRLCRGGCKRYRTSTGASGLPMNYFCEAYYNFFESNIAGIAEIADELKKELIGK